MPNSPVRVAVDVGSVIADTYTIEALLGRGGMGAVFLASHKRLAGKQVAIKILHTEIADTEVIARFKREAEIAAKLNHPNIVGVIDYNVSPDGMPYLVLDYLEGETLADRIARGPLALDHAMSIVRQVGSALAAAHGAGIVHRDLKPQNIFLVTSEIDGRTIEVAKVLDFGISKIRGSETVKTQDSVLLGTPQYMSPEQAIGQHTSIDERTDVFALGAIVYEMLSGQPAFGGDSLPAVVFQVVYEQPPPLAERAPGVPPGVIDAVERAMAKPPGERFATVSGFVEALTGRPLATTRIPAAMAAPRAAPPGEAFARTMGSGDHGDLVNPMLATAAPTPAPRPLTASAQPPSLSRSSAPPGAADPGAVPATAAPTVDLPGARRAQPGSHRRWPGLVIAGVIAAAVAGGAVVVMNSRAPQPPAAPAQVAGPAPAVVAAAAEARPAEARPAEARPAEAKPAAAAHAGDEPAPVKPAPKSHAKSPAKLPVAPHPAPPTAEPATAESPEVGADLDDDVPRKLHEATAALEHKNFELAERLANAIINSPAGAKQRATARLIHGQVACIAHNDQEAAQIDVRNLESFRALRSRLLNVCRSHGVVLNP